MNKIKSQMEGGLTVAGFKSRAGEKSDIAYQVEQSPTLLAGCDDASVVITPISFTSHSQISRTKGIVRRLTPLECERLQGFPDGWTQIGEAVDCLRYEVDGEEYIEVIYEYTNSAGKRLKTTDSARYKALGNSIALPSWAYVLQKLSLCCGAEHTMASLFDGIGGFPLIWEGLHGQGSCLWASEIEEFPIAVTKEHFPEQE